MLIDDIGTLVIGEDGDDEEGGFKDDGNCDGNCDGDFIDISGAGSFQVPRLECRSHSFSREAVGVDIASRFFDSSTASAER